MLEKNGEWCHVPPRRPRGVQAQKAQIAKAKTNACTAAVKSRRWKRRPSSSSSSSKQGAGPIGGGDRHRRRPDQDAARRAVSRTGDLRGARPLPAAAPRTGRAPGNFVDRLAPAPGGPICASPASTGRSAGGSCSCRAGGRPPSPRASRRRLALPRASGAVLIGAVAMRGAGSHL